MSDLTLLTHCVRISSAGEPDRFPSARANEEAEKPAFARIWKMDDKTKELTAYHPNTGGTCTYYLPSRPTTGIDMVGNPSMDSYGSGDRARLSFSESSAGDEPCRNWSSSGEYDSMQNQVRP